MLNVLNVVSHDIEKNFYDPTLKGLDWKALTEETKQKIQNATSNSQMITAIYLLVDKLKDSHTQFLPPGRVARPLYGFDAKAFGNEIRIYEIKKGSSAEKAGLQIGDRIVSVNGFKTGRSSFDLMMLDMRLLRPVPSMKIVYTRGDSPEQSTEVVPKIKTSTMVQDLTNDLNLWALIDELYSTTRRDYYGTFDNDIGYGQVSDFYTEQVKITGVLEHPKATIIDLRGNPGGSQDALLEFAGHFEPEVTTMGEMITRKKTEPLKIKQRNPSFLGPLVVLIDSRSGSAAEMFARHAQISRKAIVVGDRSSGRVNSSIFYAEQIGTDRVIPFGVQVSVGKIVFPNGEELEHHPVIPDIPCLPNGDDLHEHRDPCLKMAVAAARKALGRGDQLPEGEARQIDSFAERIFRERQEILDSTRD